MAEKMHGAFRAVRQSEIMRYEVWDIWDFENTYTFYCI
jgi:hypothetical protein